MNKLLCIGLLGLSFAVTAQQKTPTETYSDLKKVGKLMGNEPVFQNPNATKSLHISGLSNSLSKNGLQYNQTMATSSACN
ncbi:MAG: hypothetical protein ABI388_06555, partial [Bacteroidia bacterium]